MEGLVISPHIIGRISAWSKTHSHMHTTEDWISPVVQSQSHLCVYIDTNTLVFLSNGHYRVIFADLSFPLSLSCTHTMFSSAAFLKLLAMLRGNVIQLIQNEWKGIFRNSPPRLVTTKTDISPPLAPPFPLFPSSLLFVCFPLPSWKIVSISSIIVSEYQKCVIRFWCEIKGTVYHQVNNICLCVRLLPGGAPSVGSFLLWPWAASDFQPPAVGRLHHVGLSVVGPTHTYTETHLRCDLLSKVNVDSSQKNLTLSPPTSYC